MNRVDVVCETLKGFPVELASTLFSCWLPLLNVKAVVPLAEENLEFANGLFAEMTELLLFPETELFPVIPAKGLVLDLLRAGCCSCCCWNIPVPLGTCPVGVL